MPAEPAITVLVPAFQAAPFVANTLVSISSQSHEEFTAIISVDLSDDQTFDICAEHAAHDGRFKVIRQSKRLGWVDNSNFLLSQLESPYALFAFHDDLLSPIYLHSLKTALDAHPEASVAFADTLLTRLDGSQELWQYADLDGVAEACERGQRVLSRRGRWWVPNRGMFRTAAARKVGGLRKHDSGEFSADLPWLFHLSLVGSFVRIPETLCYKFYREGSLSRTWRFSFRQNFDVLVACMREIWLSELDVADKLALSEPLHMLLKENLPNRQSQDPG
ncbi:glycosyltransferase family 2 protein [Aestuariivirga sp.]|jgi:glycosyltransferase involved in cell wall biosynthesis|uniref:glycosyltransferase family 2 protein n=1 Tax=Aestuariivirga sp. TaxID=2650926 RepID=UPI003784D876